MGEIELIECRTNVCENHISSPYPIQYAHGKEAQTQHKARANEWRIGYERERVAGILVVCKKPIRYNANESTCSRIYAVL